MGSMQQPLPLGKAPVADPIAEAWGVARPAGLFIVKEDGRFKLFRRLPHRVVLEGARRDAVTFLRFVKRVAEAR